MLLGLGSILGTGIFVSIGIAAGIAGSSVVIAVALAAVVATLNGLSSAQLAASHPVSGGTYEYGYRYLSSTLGFTAGWMFLCAKSASAATAALGLAGYALTLAGRSETTWRIAIALAAVILITVLVAGGMRRSNAANAAIVSLTIGSLLVFVIAGAPAALEPATPSVTPPQATGGGSLALLHATALMFVAYTGYGRIATLGEEVRDPAKSIPRAIVITLIATMLLYVAVTAVAVGVAGAPGLAEATRSNAAPLAVVARRLDTPVVVWVLSVGAVTAMVGVLLNLLLGLSRVLLAMGRRHDMPAAVARISPRTSSPVVAVIAVGCIVAGLSLLGDVKTTWSFSAFTVLIYYAITNLAALRLPPEHRRYPRFVAVCGLAGCLALAFFVPPTVWAMGLGILAAGLVWHRVARWLASRGTGER